MRFLIVGSFLACFFLLSACESQNIDSIKTVSYVYKNNSGKNLTLEVFNSEDEIIEAFSISNGDKIVTNTTRFEVPAVFHFESFENKIGDSVIVKFDDNKCLYYSKNNKDRIFDITEYENYSEDLIGKSEYSIIYIFKSEDYMNSENCN